MDLLSQSSDPFSVGYMQKNVNFRQKTNFLTPKWGVPNPKSPIVLFLMKNGTERTPYLPHNLGKLSSYKRFKVRRLQKKVEARCTKTHF